MNESKQNNIVLPENFKRVGCLQLVLDNSYFFSKYPKFLFYRIDMENKLPVIHSSKKMTILLHI